MKKIVGVLVIIASVYLFSCKKSNNGSTTYSPDCSGTTPTYTSVASPLFSTYCATSGCHNTGSNNGPGALTTHAEIKNAAVTIRATIISGRMPQGTTLSSEQKNKIVCWIDAGAINN